MAGVDEWRRDQRHIRRARSIQVRNHNGQIQVDHGGNLIGEEGQVVAALPSSSRTAEHSSYFVSSRGSNADQIDAALSRLWPARSLNGRPRQTLDGKTTIRGTRRCVAK
jgi:hypothetical protein